MLLGFQETLSNAISRLESRPQDQLVGLIGAKNAAPELRVAAALLVVGASVEFKHSEDIDELTMVLSGVEDDARSVANPFDTDAGRLFVKLHALPMSEWGDCADASEVLDLIVMNVVARARKPDGYIEKGWNTTLLLASGRDGYWWVDWLRSESSHPTSEDLNYE